MDEKVLHRAIKESVKSPSDDFTDKLMDTILMQNEMEVIHTRKLRVLSVACLLVIVMSLFVVLPSFQFFDRTFQISPLILPVLSLLFLIFEINQLSDLKQKLSMIEKNNWVQPA